MLRRIIKMAAAAAVVALLLYAGGMQAPQSAQALPPPPCPVAAGPVGPVKYRIFATNPGPAATGVCISLPFVPPVGAGAVIQAPPVCPAIVFPSVGGGPGGPGDLVWADWGPPACVAAGQSVVLEFTGPAGLPLGRLVGAASWPAVGDATVWPAACPAGPAGAGAVALIATAVAPAGGPYDGVCLNIPTASGSGATVTATATTMTDTAAAWPVNQFVGQCVMMGASTGTIASNTATTLTLTAAWSGGTPPNGSAYTIGCAIHAPVMMANPAGCGAPGLSAPNAPPAVIGPFFGAAVNQIWVDWTVKCAAAASVVTIGFMGPTGLAGVCAACATWLGSAATGDVTITKAAPSVGGESQAPDVAALTPSATTSSGTDYLPYVGGVIGAAVLVVILLASAWYVRRRHA